MNSVRGSHEQCEGDAKKMTGADPQKLIQSPAAALFPPVRLQGPSQMKPVPTGLTAVPLLPLSLGLAGAIPFVATAPPLPSLLPLPVRSEPHPYPLSCPLQCVLSPNTSFASPAHPRTVSEKLSQTWVLENPSSSCNL